MYSDKCTKLWFLFIICYKQRMRGYNERKILSHFFIGIVAVIYLYFFLMAIVFVNLNNFTTVMFVIYNLIFLLFATSVLQTIRTNPGRIVPINHPQGRFCILCRVYKPQRSHHCITCQQCTLCMHRHQSWLDTCIGFNNRKFIILVIFYLVLQRLTQQIIFFYSLGKIVALFNNGSPLLAILIIISSIIDLILLVLISLLLYMEIKLVLCNRTIMEDLSVLRNPNATEPDKYHIGVYRNWEQVFGPHWLTWWLPFFLPGQGPVGDGLTFPHNSDLHPI